MNCNGAAARFFGNCHDVTVFAVLTVRWEFIAVATMGLLGVAHLIFFAVTGQYIDRLLRVQKPKTWGSVLVVVIANLLFLALAVYVFAVFVAGNNRR